MASQKKSINFNEYWDFIKREAGLRGWSDSEFMKICKVPRQRYYEFTNQRNLTGTYMLRIMEGMGLTQKMLEQKTKIKFSDEQRRELKKESWIAAHPDIVDALVDNPKLVDILRSQISLFKK